MSTVQTGTRTEPAIALSGVTKQFGTTVAVDGLSLSVKPGTTFGLIGPNGAGKSTTIKMMMGILLPTTGTIRILGRDVATEAEETKQRVGYVPELHFMDRWMRVQEVTGYCRAMYARWNDDVCREMLERFELEPTAKVAQMSKGMLVKLSLVLAVSHEPEMLLMDEPMAGLDPVGREEFLDGVLRTVCDRGQTVLLSTHALDDIQRIADEIGFLYDGRLLLQRNVEELLSSTRRIRATITQESVPQQVAANVVWQQVEGRNWTATVVDFTAETLQQLEALPGVEHAEVIQIGLEDLFKDLVKGQRSVS